MVRPRKLRFIGMQPGVRLFKPAGVPVQEADRVVLSLDQFEAIRLVDLEGMDHSGAAELMNVSRPTLSRLVEEARRCVADALVNGKALVIDGGNVEMVARMRCRDCGQEVPHTRRGGRGHRCRGWDR